MSDARKEPSEAATAIFLATNGLDLEERRSALLQNLGFLLTNRRSLEDADAEVEEACRYLRKCVDGIRKGTMN